MPQMAMAALISPELRSPLPIDSDRQVLCLILSLKDHLFRTRQFIIFCIFHYLIIAVATTDAFGCSARK